MGSGKEEKSEGQKENASSSLIGNFKDKVLGSGDGKKTTDMKGVNVSTGDVGLFSGNKIEAKKSGAEKVNAGHHNKYENDGAVNIGTTDNSCVLL